MDSPERDNGKQPAEHEEFVTVRVNRRTGAFSVDSNCHLLPDQLGLLQFGEMFLKGQWATRQAVQCGPRIVPSAVLPPRSH